MLKCIDLKFIHFRQVLELIFNRHLQKPLLEAKDIS